MDKSLIEGLQFFLKWHWVRAYTTCILYCTSNRNVNKTTIKKRNANRPHVVAAVFEWCDHAFLLGN